MHRKFCKAVKCHYLKPPILISTIPSCTKKGKCVRTAKEVFEWLEEQSWYSLVKKYNEYISKGE